MDLKIYVHEDDEVRLERRMKRDTETRGKKVEDIIERWNNFVQPMFNQFVLPTMKRANIIVNGNDTNTYALKFISDHLVSNFIKIKSPSLSFTISFYSKCLIELIFLDFDYLGILFLLISVSKISISV